MDGRSRYMYIVLGGHLCIKHWVHLNDICLLTCICLWQISQIQTYLRVVVGPGLVSTSPAFMTIKRGRRGRHNLHSGLPDAV